MHTTLERKEVIGFDLSKATDDRFLHENSIQI